MRSISSYNRIIKRIESNIGLTESRIHDFRHMVATALQNAEVPSSKITIQLGHSNTSVTEKVYLHSERVDITGNAKKLREAFGFDNI